LPQLPGAAAWQLPLPSQQPLGHEVASHTQLPPMQCWPAAQTLPLVPQAQLPPTQRSASIPQLPVHSPPLAPQWVVLMVTQPVPSSQEPALQTQPLVASQR
jgi:hypothetical protein